MPHDEQAQRVRDALAALQENVADGETLSARQTAELAATCDCPLRVVEAVALRQGIVPLRYDRNLGTLGAEGQCKLLAARAVVVGLGGLGGYVLETLARMGVGRLTGIDGDSFAETDLNRQLLSQAGTMGQRKVNIAARRMAAVNPAVEFTAHAARLEDLDDDCLADCDVAFDCLDTVPARRLLAAGCATAGTPLIHGAIAGWSGQVALCPPGGDLLEKLYHGPPRGLEELSGNLPFTAAVAANLMTARGIRVLLSRDESTSAQKLLFFDLLADTWETIDL